MFKIHPFLEGQGFLLEFPFLHFAGIALYVIYRINVGLNYNRIKLQILRN